MIIQHTEGLYYWVFYSGSNMLFDWRRALLIYILCKLGYLGHNMCQKDIILFDISVNFS